MNARVTSADVARITGLSRTTVSYVLNKTPGHRVPEATQQRVLDAAAQLGYTPSAPARALRSGRSNVVLAVLPDWPISTVLAELLESCSTLMMNAGYTLVAHPTHGRSRPLSDLWRTISPAAVIITDEISPEDANAVRAAGIPVLLTTLGDPIDQAARLSVSQELIGHLQVTRLIAAGHTHIGYAASGDPRLAPFDEPRYAGVVRACAGNNLPAPIAFPVPLEMGAAAEAIRRWKAMEPAITAVCAFNDEGAISLVTAARANRVRVPEELAVIGCDDIPLASVSDPPLTTIALDVVRLSEHLVDATIRGIEGDRPKRMTEPLYRLVDRRSV